MYGVTLLPVSPVMYFEAVSVAWHRVHGARATASLAAAHLEVAVADGALHAQPGSLHRERLQEEGAAQRRPARGGGCRAHRRPCCLEIARSREDDAILHHVVGNQQAQGTMRSRTKDGAAAATTLEPRTKERVRGRFPNALSACRVEPHMRHAGPRRSQAP